MTTLHVLYSPRWPAELERLWSPGDTLLLAGASVTLGHRGHGPLQQFMQRTGSGTTVLALADAVHCRGLQRHWPASIALIDSAAWVDAVIAHPKSLSWA